jgi:hypothetical protein
MLDDAADKKAASFPLKILFHSDSAKSVNADSGEA